MSIVARFLAEPVVITNVVGAILGLLVVVGMDFPADLEVALAAVIVTLATAVSRAFVTPA